MQIERPLLWTYLFAAVIALAGVLVFRHFSEWSGIAGILTNDQLVTLQEYKDTRTGRRGGRGHEPLDCSAYQ